MKNIIITVAPLAQHVYDKITRFPTAAELAGEIIGCHNAGAAVCHLHVIDENGNPTKDTSFFEEVLGRVRKECDIIMQSSTGGLSDLDLDERSICVGVPGVEMASLNMGTCNINDMPYVNTAADVRYWSQKMNRHNVKPELVFFEPGMLTIMNRTEELSIREPYVINLALGFSNTLPSSAENLLFMVSKMPPRVEWSVTSHHSQDLSMQALAVMLGGNVRLGFEDSFYLRPGEKAKNNIELVQEAKKMLDLLGKKTASPEETRKRYGITKSTIL